MTDYAEQIFQSIDTIVSERIKSINYDTTLTCTITDDSQKKEGIYKVNNGSATFTAYSSNTTYSKGNVVYVQVPNGDWNEQKIILSKKPNDSEAPLSYTKPFDTFVDLSGNLILQGIEQKGLIANGDTRAIENLWTYNGKPLAGYTRLGVKAEFQSWLRELGAIEGSYGLRLIVNQTEKIENEEKIINNYIFDFNCSDMIGNPYNFESFFSQEILFDISNIEKIESITAEFYQDKDSFLNINKEVITHDVGPNLFIKDLYISVGYDSSAFDTDTVVIFSHNDNQYEATTMPPEKDYKKIQLRWVHKFDDDSIKVVDDLDYELYWYRKVLGESSHIPQSGADWRLLSSEVNGGSLTIADSSWIEHNANNTDERYPSKFTTWLIPDVTLAEEKIKAIIKYNDQYYYSNILTFTNKREVISKPTVDAVKALSIVCEDDSYGNYFIYKQGGQLVNSADASKVRRLRLYFNDAPLTEAESIEWVFPTKNTMLGLFSTVPTPNSEENDDWLDDTNCRHIRKFGEASDSYSLKGNNYYNYKIGSFYSQQKNNNIIKCIIVKDKVTYTATKEFTFGPTGTSGTDYTFVLDFENGVNALSTLDGETEKVYARLYDYEGKEVDKLTTGTTIEWDLIRDNGYISKGASGEENGYYYISLNLLATSVPNNNYTILQATLKGWGNYPLIAYLPIPITSGSKKDFISGATTIMYSSLGTLDDVSFYQNPYILYIASTNVESEDIEKDIYPEWTLVSPKNTNGNTIIGAPTLKEKTNTTPTQYYLQPSIIYLEDTFACVSCSAWSQPILIYQNKYPASIVNSWNGELTLDDKNNAILAAKMVAGSKDSNNKFSGVMMGDWDGDDNEKEITKSTGIYGFSHGEASFGFKDDGTAFIGKSGSGRINFDGNGGTICGASFGQTDSNGSFYQGVKIDLDSSPYLQVQGTKKMLMYVGNNNYYLQSNNYIDDSSLETVETQVALGRCYNKSTYDRWHRLYGTLYNSNGVEYNYSSSTAGTYLYYKSHEIKSTTNRQGSYFDLVEGNIYINQGYINGDVILRPDQGIKYTTYKQKEYGIITGEAKTVPQASLVSVLSDLYTNVSRAQAQGEAATELASYAATIAETAKNAAKRAQAATDGLQNYLQVKYYTGTESDGITYKDGHEYIQLNGGDGEGKYDSPTTYVQVGNSITLQTKNKIYLRSGGGNTKFIDAGNNIIYTTGGISFHNNNGVTAIVDINYSSWNTLQSSVSDLKSQISSLQSRVTQLEKASSS